MPPYRASFVLECCITVSNAPVLFPSLCSNRQTCLTYIVSPLVAHQFQHAIWGSVLRVHPGLNLAPSSTAACERLLTGNCPDPMSTAARALVHGHLQKTLWRHPANCRRCHWRAACKAHAPANGSARLDKQLSAEGLNSRCLRPQWRPMLS
ncbi:hypothetical protein BDV96DRAFT_568750 [Lophiotrema nucula]|uniref:Uncharacterized protein n=1 Tax=Lophiotrema nucula TaxID=690887 RepID=A0A6A5ZIR7_9PLEO|nr:hypothetical protein BDV96DRAFT_568750 [Lophiotrema nucula]